MLSAKAWEPAELEEVDTVGWPGNVPMPVSRCLAQFILIALSFCRRAVIKETGAVRSRDGCFLQGMIWGSGRRSTKALADTKRTGEVRKLFKMDSLSSRGVGTGGNQKVRVKTSRTLDAIEEKHPRPSGRRSTKSFMIKRL